MSLLREKDGFTLIEILLVVLIIGVLLAVIVPRAWRARIDAKYGLVRQNCSELAAFSNQWVEKAINAQDENTSTATNADYYASLAGDNQKKATGPNTGTWIASGGTTNWNSQVGATRIKIVGRFMDNQATDTAPEDTVQDITPPDKIPRNPFNGINVYAKPNDPTALTPPSPITGAIAVGGMREMKAPTATSDPGWAYYAFCFQGTDSTETLLTDPKAFHGGQELDTIEGLRNGIFLGRAR